MNLFNATKKAVAILGIAAGVVFAQGVDTAYVPFRVNVDANILAELKNGATVTASVQKDVAAGEDVVLSVPLPKTTFVSFESQRRPELPRISGNRSGKVTLNLPNQSYKNATVALYSVNGKRVLNAKFSATQTVNNVSRRSVVAGVYLLSITDSDNAATPLTSRITHRGGSLEIDAAFGDENFVSAPVMAKKAADGDWTITVSAVEAGYIDSTYTLGLVSGTNPKQNISLRASGGGGGGGNNNCTSGATCKQVTIGTQVWMAENLNIATSSGSWCYGDSSSYCDEYGRLYDWAMAMTVCPSGWHLPSRTEWDQLVTTVGGSSTAGSKLKSTSGWYNNGNGTDEYGFSALPGGYRRTGYFGHIGYGGWWTATEIEGGGAYGRIMVYNSGNVDEYSYGKEGGYSVRCLRD